MNLKTVRACATRAFPTKALSLCALSLCASAVPVAAQPKAASSPASKPASTPASKPAPGNAAEVNGEKIPNGDVDRRLARIKSAQPSLQADTAEARKALQDIRGAVVEDIVDFRLRVQEAKKQKLTPAPATVDTAIADFRKNFKTEAEMKAQLAKEGKSLGDLRLLITEGIMVNALENKWTSAVQVTENEIGEAYRTNITRYTVPEGVRARHILFAFGKQNPTAEDKSAALKKAQNALLQVRAPGADFGTLARNLSDDTGSKDRGGDLGPFPRGTMIEPFEKAAFGAKAGEIVGPVETVFGYHIIKVENKIAGRTLPIEEARDDLRAQILPVKREQAIVDKMNALRQSAKIKKA